MSAAPVKREAPWSVAVPPDLYRDLAWFFLESPARLGFRSGQGGVTARIEGHSSRTTAGGPKTDDGESVVDAFRNLQTPWDRDNDNLDIFDRMNLRIEEIGRHRRIRAGLSDMSARHQATLCAMFEERSWPNALTQTFGEATGLAVRSRSAREAFRDARPGKRARLACVRDWLDDYCRHNPEEEKIATIRVDIRAAVLAAFAEYGLCRRLAPRSR